MNNLFILLQATSGKGGGYEQLMMIGALILVFYFFMIRPQMKKSKEIKKFRSELKKGDKILTIGGIYGKIHEIKENYIMVEIDNNVRIKVSPSAIVKDQTDLQTK